MLRCLEMGLKPSDLKYFTMGFVMDMLTEKQNDSYKYPFKATQEDFDRF